MSEFKYACPVCGQHIRCDSSQAGTVMDCPTCFQKIVVPQAPASEDQKFIITGSLLTEKKTSLPGTTEAAAPQKNTPVAAIAFVVILLLLGAGGIILWMRLPAGSTAGWQSADVGDASPAGSVASAKGIFTIIGAGSDVWRRADGFHFAFQPLNGNGSLVAEVLNLQNTHEWAKAGVMIRESTAADAKFALASIRADGQAQFVWRSATQGEAGSSLLAGGAGFPKWVKITRSGDTFAAYFRKTASDEWQRVGDAQAITMTPGTQAGLIVCSHNAGTLSQAQFDHVGIQTPQSSPPAPASKPPPVAPPASDTNWLLDLRVAAIPEAPAAGRIHGNDFMIERASFQNGTLTLRAGTHGTVESGVILNFEGATTEALAGKTFNITTNVEKAAPVQLRWKDGDELQKANLTNGYALRLEFNAEANHHLPGKIYLCTPDAEKSYLMGTFNANIVVPKPKVPKQ